MKVRKNASAYQELANEYEIDLGLNEEQSIAMHSNQPFMLNEDQLDYIVDQMTVTVGIDRYLQAHSEVLLPIALSLFVINERLWKIMERKPWDKEKMLAMCTIPLCTWERKAETTSNPKGSNRWDIHPNSLELALEKNPKILVCGEGGDFSGFIEQSQITMRKFGIPESRKLIPNYTFEQLQMEVKLDRAVFEIHPSPRDNLDYDYSEPARTFYNHGFAISVPGEDVILKVSKRKSLKMAGEVFLLIGSQILEDDDTQHYRALKIDILLRALQRRFT
ncbi:hypothetical protein EU528_11235 [Candidatus Thorarchaeota archaeon]|nr:MAG: hypothetical protein EU528_11235 [Candidatus Thorarchaeota archaeon]